MIGLVKNYLFNLLFYTLNFIFAILLSVILARSLGATKMGQYSYMIWLMSSLALILTLGLPKALTRFIALFNPGEENISTTRLISRVLIFELKVSSIATVIFFIILTVTNLNDKLFYYIILLSFPILVLNNILSAAFQGVQKFKLNSQISLVILSSNLLFTMLVIVLKGGVKELLILNLFIAIMTLVVSWYFLRKNIKFNSPKLDSNSYSQIFKYTTSTSLMVFIDLIVLERSEILFLTLFSSIEQVAFYSLAFGLVAKAMALLSGALSGVIMPKVAEYHGGENHQGITTIYYHSTRFLMFIILPLALGGIVISDLLINLLYGNTYLPMIPVLNILLISGGLIAVVAAASSVIYGIGKQIVILKIGIALVIINLTLDLFLIPRFHAIGAALATAIAQVVGVFLGTFYIVYIRKMKFPWYPSLKVLVSATFSASIIFLMKSYWLNSTLIQLIILGLFFILFYLSFLMVLKFFDKKDLILIETARKIFVTRKAEN